MPKRDINSLKQATLRAQINAGIAAIKRDEFTEIADAELERYLEDLEMAAVKQTW
jgi:hypothetical protein